MKELIMTVTSKGQVTIPAEARRHLNIKEGQKVALVLEPDGSVRLKLPRYSSVRALLDVPSSKLTQELTWQAMRDIAREDALKHHKKP